VKGSRRRTSGKPSLGPVVERIRSIEASGRSWALSASEVRGLLGISRENFYRAVYWVEASGNPLIGLPAARAQYSQENIWEFVALVELFCGRETEDRLEKAGIFFSHPEQLEIMSVFLSIVADAVRSHEIEVEVFSAMLRTFVRYERAREVYLEEYFRLPELIDEVVSKYCRTRSFEIPDLAAANVRRLLEFFLQKHVIEPLSLLAGVAVGLHAQAVEEGYVEEAASAGAFETRGRDSRGRGEQTYSPAGIEAVQAARSTMELAKEQITLPLLKSRYKRLMKIYHPDINPRGLRRCQEINSAYTLLLSSL